MSEWNRADHWRTELARTAGAVPVDSVVEFGLALLGELVKRGTPHGALSPEAISVRREGSVLRVRIDTAPTDPMQETLLATGSRSMSAHPGVHYRANEQFVSDWFDARADCFAVGVMLYELAAGQLPFGQGITGSFQVFLKLKRGGFPSLRELRPEIPEALAAVIVRALALRPEERFDGVATMATALRAFVRSPAPMPHIAPRQAGWQAAASSPIARPAPDQSGVPLDPLRPIETGVLPVATQAAIAAFRAGGATATEPSAPAPTAPLRLPIVEHEMEFGGIAHRLSSGPPSQPIPRAEPLTRATPLSTPVARPPIVMAPFATPPSRPVVVAPTPVVERPTAPAEQPLRVAPRFGPQTDPFEARPSPSERTQITGPPVQMQRAPIPAAVTSRLVEPLHIAPAAPSGIPEPLRMEPALPPPPASVPTAPRTLPPPAPPPRPRTIAPAPPVVAPTPRMTPTASPVVPRPTAPLPSAPARTPTSEAPTAVARTPTPPAPRVEPRAMATVVASVPLQEQLLARSTQLVEPDLAALRRMTEPSPPTASAPTPVPAPPRAEPATASTEDRPVPPAEDTARRSAGEITPPEGNSSEPTQPSVGRKEVVTIGVVLLLLGAGAGLLVKLPSRAVKQVAAVECVPGPAQVCPPPPAPVAMPEPTPPAPVQCVPPKPSPKLTCFYDGLRDGQARYLRGDRSGALEAFQAAEACMPRNPALLKWIGRCHEDLRDREEARTYYDRYLRRRPRADDADFYRTKVEALTRAPDGGTR